MRDRKEKLEAELCYRRLLNASEASYYLGLGKNRGVEFAKSIDAEIKIGRRALYDKVKIDQYLDSLTGVG